MSRLLHLAFACAIAVPPVEADTERAQRLADRVDAFHSGTDAPFDKPLRLLYFHPADASPQRDYQARVSRMMFDIRDFYRDEMARLGFGDRPIPLEMKDDRLVIHRVEGSDPLNSYRNDTESASRIMKDAREQLGDRINFDREFCLVICGLCRRLENGSYLFNSPYFGAGDANHIQGRCFAADTEMMDTLHYADEETRFVYREHLGRFEKTLGAFNRLYIGGLAHELGHGLSLPHNKEKPWQKSRLGTALMGSGNFTWRGESIGRKGSFLTLASAVRLLSHPLLTGSSKQRFAPTRAALKELFFRPQEERRLKLSGRIQSDPPAFAVIVDTDPEGNSNYNSYTWVGEVDEDGGFEVGVWYLDNGPNELRITACHLNGATTELTRLPMPVEDGHPASMDELAAAWQWREAETRVARGDLEGASAFLSGGEGEGEFQDRLDHLKFLLKPQPQPVQLDSIEDSSASIADAVWESASVGWGTPTRNRYDSEPHGRNGVCLVLGGSLHRKGLYAHSPSTYRFRLNGKWTRFTAVGGLQEGATTLSSGVFIVRGDGEELHRGTKVTGSTLDAMDVDVSGVQELELIVESGKADNHACWTVWGSPTVHR